MKKYVLGTAQLSNKSYGITDDKKILNKQKIFEILNFAWQNGITHFDTAPSYENEHIIGSFIKFKKLTNKINIITKIPPLGNGRNFLKKTFNSIERSLKKLNINSIYCLFIHDQNDFKRIRRDKTFFKQIKKEFKINKFGFSVYDRFIAEKIIQEFPNACIQFPYNMINNTFESLKKGKSTFFARSIFLQGLLTSKKIKRFDKKLTSQHREYLQFLKKKKLDPIKLSLDYVSANNKIDHVIFGVKNTTQLKSIINHKVRKKIKKNIIKKIGDFFKEKYKDPRNWS